MDHIKYLRTFVGHAPLLLVGAAALISDGQGRLLLMLRTDNDCWGPPGGAVEPGEAVEQAARREVQEETGLVLGELVLFGVFSGPEYFYRYPSGDEVHNVIIAFLARAAGDVVKMNEEHTTWRWFAAEEIPEEISPPIRPVIERWKAHTLAQRQS